MKQRQRYLALKAKRDQLQRAHDMAWAKARELTGRVSELEAKLAGVLDRVDCALNPLPFVETPAPESGMMDGNNV